MTNLIGFDKNRENLEFKGPCKLSVNFMSNYLYVEPKNEEFKLISASFEWNYVMKKNLLFVFAEFDFLDFCLEFKNEQMCKKILDYIYTGKKNHEKEITDSISCDDSFIKQIFQKIADNPALNSALIETIATWHQLLDEDDQAKYSTVMKDYGIHDIISAAIQNEAKQREEPNLEEMRNRKRRFRQIEKEEIFHEGDKKTAMKPSKEFTKFIAFSQIQLIRVPKSRNRILLISTSDQIDSFHEYKPVSKSDLFKCIKCEKKAILDVNEDGEICVKMESKKHSCKPSMMLLENSANIKLIQKPGYNFFDNSAGKFKKVLVVFDSKDRSLCYEYSCFNGASKFYCRGCFIKKIAFSQISKANIRNEGTEKEYVEIYGEHQCEKRKYSREKYQPIFDYILKPDFEIQKFKKKGGKRGQKLIVFDPSNRNKYYQYYYYLQKKKFVCCGCHYSGKWVTATLHQNSENEEYIILSNAKHVCEMRSFDEKIILRQPQDFEIAGELKNPKIFLFETSDRNSGYEFYKNKHWSCYCAGCVSGIRNNGHRVSAFAGKLLKDEETGKYSFEMKPNQIHCCEPRPYQPEKYEIIPKTYDFFYYRLKNGPKTVKLAIKSAENNQLCFTFAYQKLSNYFICMECRRLKKSYTIKLQKDDNGKEYFNHNVKKHNCEPVKVSSIPKSDILKEHGIKMESKPKRMPKFDENKVIKSTNFELRSNKAGVPDRNLIIFNSKDETLCYEFFYDVNMKLFKCKKCKTKKSTVTAKLHKNAAEENGEEFFVVMGKNEHVCEPVKYQPK